MSLTVADLKEKLQSVIDDLEQNYDDEQKISMVSNTYFLGHANLFLGISGYDGGYIDLHNIETEDDDESEEDDD